MSNSQQFFFQHSRVWTKLVVQLLKPFGASKALSSAYCWGSESPSKIQEVTLMRPIHGNL